MKIKPVFDRLLVEPIAQADTTAGGLIIPQEAKAPPQLGTVLAVGHGRNYDGPGAIVGTAGGDQDMPTFAIRAEFQRPAMVVKEGDTVLYGKYSGSEVEVDGKKVFILREDEVLAIVEKDQQETSGTPEGAPEEAPVH